MNWDMVRNALYVGLLLVGVFLCFNAFRHKRWETGWIIAALVVLLGTMLDLIR